MDVKFFRCDKCKKKYSATELRFRCDCNSTLEAVYDYERMRKRVSWDALRARPFNHWRYREFYPDLGAANIVSLGEGGTPLTKSRNMSDGLYFKNEGINPTGSFKDRGSTVEISIAKERGAKSVVCATTGNMGASVGAYCNAADISARVYVPKSSPQTKLAQIRETCDNAVEIKGDYTRAKEFAENDFLNKGVYLTGDYQFRAEGEKSVGLEIMDVMCPDLILCPIGNGTLMHGIWKGLSELRILRMARKLPRLVGVQAKGCSTVVRAFEGNMDCVPSCVPDTVASATACGEPLDGHAALSAIRESGGCALAVSDKEIMSARKTMLRKEGIFAEPSGAMSVAGYLKIKDELSGKKSVAVITGHGLKAL